MLFVTGPYRARKKQSVIRDFVIPLFENRRIVFFEQS